MESSTMETAAASNRVASGERSDEELLLTYRKTGDRELFTALVHRYEQELFSYLRRYLNDAELAEDVFQAAMLQVHLKREQFQEGRTFRPWLYTIATNQAIDAQRRSRRHRMVSLDREGTDEANGEVGRMANLLQSTEIRPDQEAHDEERRQWVRQAVASLPEYLRSVVQLVFNQGMKYRDAAEVLGIPVGTAKSRMHTAIEKLGQKWQAEHAGN